MRYIPKNNEAMAETANKRVQLLILLRLPSQRLQVFMNSTDMLIVWYIACIPAVITKTFLICSLSLIIPPIIELQR